MAALVAEECLVGWAEPERQVKVMRVRAGSVSYGSAGGGGGASAPGSIPYMWNGGNGGNGTTSNITGAVVAYGGGGGGGADTRSVNAPGGTGGTGGGGNGGMYNAYTGTPGTAQTGGGGGGGAGSGGGAGGSGIVIISAPQNQVTATGGSHSIINGNDVWTFTSNDTWTVTSIASTPSSNFLSDSQYYYDNLPFGQVSSGNLTQQKDFVSGSTYASSTKSYNAFGLVASSTDARGNTTIYQYDPFNLHIATTTNPLSQSTAYGYNYSNGKVKLTTDPNNRLTKNIYDGVGRIIEIDQSNVTTPSTLDTAVTYQYVDSTTTPSLVHRVNYLTATTTVDYIQLLRWP